MTKTAVITGCGKGLGLALCKQFLGEGYRVCALEKMPTDALFALEKENEGLKVFTLDITDYEGIKNCKKAIEAEYESIDLLINNAAVWLDKARNEIESPDFEDDLKICALEFDINTMGPLRIIKEFLPLLRKGTDKNRAVVNMSSDCASYDPVTNWRTSEYAYCMSKAGVNIISDLLANTLKETDIKVFAVFPGWMQTEMGFAGVTDENDKPTVAPSEAASCISNLIKGPKLEYTYCNRFGERMY